VATRTRDRYLDVLRAVALVRVVTYHAYDAGWLSIVFPSMGVMFALAGSLMAASLSRQPGPVVVRHRLRRLLPPFWLFGVLVVAAMFVHGWPDRDATQLVFWFFPILDPPGSEWALQVTDPLWYIRTYLWFVLLSPLAVWAYRRWPVGTLLAPLALVLILALARPDAGGLTARAVVDVATFGACWVLGFAHRSGAIARLPLPGLLTLAGGAMLLGAGWAVVHPTDIGGYDLNEIPVAQALWSIGAVLLLLRPAPSMTWLDRVPVLGRLVTLLNARAVTVYLWHEIALVAAVPVSDRLQAPWALFPVAWVLIGVAVVAVGWVEDLAAGRAPRLLPWAAQRPAYQEVGGGPDGEQRAETAEQQAEQEAAVLAGVRPRVPDHDDRTRDRA
jgi:peptidoglycan-N-acetylglucosamine deacetylase